MLYILQADGGLRLEGLKLLQLATLYQGGCTSEPHQSELSLI